MQLSLSRIKSKKVYSNIRRLLPSLYHRHYLQNWRSANVKQNVLRSQREIKKYPFHHIWTKDMFINNYRIHVSVFMFMNMTSQQKYQIFKRAFVILIITYSYNCEKIKSGFGQLFQEIEVRRQKREGKTRRKNLSSDKVRKIRLKNPRKEWIEGSIVMKDHTSDTTSLLKHKMEFPLEANTLKYFKQLIGEANKVRACYKEF